MALDRAENRLKPGLQTAFGRIDGIWKGLADAGQRSLLTVPFKPLKRSKIGELGARFDIVLGVTPAA